MKANMTKENPITKATKDIAKDFQNIANKWANNLIMGEEDPTAFILGVILEGVRIFTADIIVELSEQGDQRLTAIQMTREYCRDLMDTIIKLKMEEKRRDDDKFNKALDKIEAEELPLPEQLSEMLARMIGKEEPQCSKQPKGQDEQ